MGNEEYIFTLINVICILKILTCYMDDKKILEIRN